MSSLAPGIEIIYTEFVYVRMCTSSSLVRRNGCEKKRSPFGDVHAVLSLSTISSHVIISNKLLHDLTNKLPRLQGPGHFGPDAPRVVHTLYAAVNSIYTYYIIYILSGKSYIYDAAMGAAGRCHA